MSPTHPIRTLLVTQLPSQWRLAPGALIGDTRGGFELRLPLPWMRSLPLASVASAELAVDGRAVPVIVRLGDRDVEVAALADEPGWWFVHDRLVLAGNTDLAPGKHELAVALALRIPYLDTEGAAPLTLPFRLAQRLERCDPDAAPDAALPRDGAHRDVDGSPPGLATPGTSGHSNANATATLAGPWRIGASAFNWSPVLAHGDASPADVAVGIVEAGIAREIEVEAGQVWRGFPVPDEREVDELRERLTDAGGRVSIVGASLDEWLGGRRRRTHDERLAWLAPQLEATARLGAEGLRLPFGQAGPRLLDALVPRLEAAGVVLFEEVQGRMSPESPAVAEHLAWLRGLDSPHVRVLLDASILMPEAPPSFLAELERLGVAGSLIERLRTAWRAPSTVAAIDAALRQGEVPSRAMTRFMDLVVRFGRSTIAELEPMLDLVGAVHAKFWDLDDADGRVSRPLCELGAALAARGFAGPVTSEWGGHAWLDDEPGEATRRHIALVRECVG